MTSRVSEKRTLYKTKLTMNKSKDKSLTFVCSTEGRTSSSVLLDNWIAYPASLGVKTLTFPSLICDSAQKKDCKKQWKLEEKNLLSVQQ